MNEKEIENLSIKQLKENIKHVYPYIEDKGSVTKIAEGIKSGSLKTCAGRSIIRMLQNSKGYHTAKEPCDFCDGTATYDNCGSFWTGSCDSCDWQIHSNEA